MSKHVCSLFGNAPLKPEIGGVWLHSHMTKTATATSSVAAVVSAVAATTSAAAATGNELRAVHPGDRKCPWVIQGHRGQRINVSLIILHRRLDGDEEEDDDDDVDGDDNNDGEMTSSRCPDMRIVVKDSKKIIGCPYLDIKDAKISKARSRDQINNNNNNNSNNNNINNNNNIISDTKNHLNNNNNIKKDDNDENDVMVVTCNSNSSLVYRLSFDHDVIFYTDVIVISCGRWFKAFHGPKSRININNINNININNININNININNNNIFNCSQIKLVFCGSNYNYYNNYNNNYYNYYNYDNSYNYYYYYNYDNSNYNHYNNDNNRFIIIIIADVSAINTRIETGKCH
ncbi:hypothetical protein HELRODRAFT_172295 [Helobdella robusta]|uniref:Uncharacterized protein n=1 Tax=Helobdella robusta TaxID=6412 RepID=T1F567_HELRO|nr:hypothetical protein HELRODRAFT_172295 [Helobdella robusta]ESO04630.1 hypothetical protein HELRODRAFT_172295 [Helobdella robusta]